MKNEITNKEHIEFLRSLVRNGEVRLVSYKQLLETAYKEKQPEFFKSHLRELKNIEDSLLKSYRKELEYENQGLNPPYCYK